METYRIFRMDAPTFLEREVLNELGFPVEPISYSDAKFIADLMKQLNPHTEFTIVSSRGVRTTLH